MASTTQQNQKRGSGKTILIVLLIISMLCNCLLVLFAYVKSVEAAQAQVISQSESERVQKLIEEFEAMKGELEKRQQSLDSLIREYSK